MKTFEEFQKEFQDIYERYATLDLKQRALKKEEAQLHKELANEVRRYIDFDKAYHFLPNPYETLSTKGIVTNTDGRIILSLDGRGLTIKLKDVLSSCWTLNAIPDNIDNILEDAEWSYNAYLKTLNLEKDGKCY